MLHAIHNWIKGWPLQVGGYYDYKVSGWLKEFTRNYDIVYFHHIRMAPYVIGIKGFRILDYHDAISMHYRIAIPYAKGFWKIFYILESKRLLSYELEMLKKFDRSFIISPVDKEYLLSKLRSKSPSDKYSPITVIPMGVKEEVMVRDKRAQSEENLIAFLGKMNYYPNEDAAIYFAKDILPIIKQKIRDIEFFVIGACPTRKVLQLQRAEQVHVTGFVKDPYDYIERAKVVVAPMRFGAGMQNKILEAMALGKAVVTTPIGANGIEGKDGEHFMVAHSREEIIEKIWELFRDNKKRRSLGQNAKELIKEKYTWEVIGQRLFREIEQLI